jgi:hypothetical protein
LISTISTATYFPRLPAFCATQQNALLFVSKRYAEFSHLKNSIFSCSVSKNQNCLHNLQPRETTGKSGRKALQCAGMPEFGHHARTGIEKTEQAHIGKQI